MLRRVRWFFRALMLRCPLCGMNWPRGHWLRLARQCPTCDLHLERLENDFFLGAYTINLFATMMVALLAGLASLLWSRMPTLLRDAAMTVAIAAFAVGFYPFSKLLWLAVDLQFRPPFGKDFGDEGD